MRQATGLHCFSEKWLRHAPCMPVSKFRCGRTPAIQQVRNAAAVSLHFLSMPNDPVQASAVSAFQGAGFCSSRPTNGGKHLTASRTGVILTAGPRLFCKREVQIETGLYVAPYLRQCFATISYRGEPVEV
ncbi:hypothetical protein UC8_33570 [Roseimaritima ulvae]|uniref:Uncharacterized protein n=1 Tax=Roseimaritima ulvae TaxID=980254 RepID=A0A5B9QQP5_9BACT|nr:hypothetical protein UC8_33570 [Roseimaritima ulvae]